MSPELTNRPTRKKKKKSRTWLYLTLGFLLLVALGVAAKMKNGNREKGTEVTLGTVERRTITELVTATGKIQPEVEVKISAEVAGEIVELPVREGQSVKKGDLLVSIRADSYVYQVQQREADLLAAQAAAVQSKARFAKARDDLKRSTDLYGKKLISESDIDSSRTELAVADATFRSAEAQVTRAEGLLSQSKDLLEKTTIYSPIDGSISALNSELGERVVATGSFAGTEIMKVANLDDMEVQVDVNENDIVNVKVGNPVAISIDAFPKRIFTGEVTEIAAGARTTGANTQDQVTEFEVRIKITQREPRIRPGMSATASVETASVPDVLAVPIQAVTVRARESDKTLEQLEKARDKETKELQGEGAALAVSPERVEAMEKRDRDSLQRVVFVYADGKAKMVPVETGLSDTSHMEIVSGLTEGQKIVTGSYSVITRTLKDDMAVKEKLDPKKKAEGKE